MYILWSGTRDISSQSRAPTLFCLPSLQTRPEAFPGLCNSNLLLYALFVDAMALVRAPHGQIKPSTKARYQQEDPD